AHILALADAHHRRTGEWPKTLSGKVVEAEGETWYALDTAWHCARGHGDCLAAHHCCKHWAGRSLLRLATTRDARLRSLVLLLIVFYQRVAKVIVEVAVDAVDVIGLVLRIVVLNQECRALNEIMVRLAGLEAASPLKMDLLRASAIDACQVLIREFLS